jgi:tRNA threonylcarbamoyl adenosine modification protein YeaZ
MRPFLLIDSHGEPARIGLPGNERTIPNRNALAERLVAEIDAVLREARLHLPELAGIGVVAGPGSFTGLRLGIAAANALAWSHRLPVVPVPASEAPSFEAFAASVEKRFAEGRTARAAVPEYGREPAITPPRRSGKS